MRVSTKNNKLYTESAPLGIDLRPSQAKGHATHIKNLLPVDGSLRKRKGICDVAHFGIQGQPELKINGIYNLNGEKIVHAGEYFFKCPNDFGVNEGSLLCTGQRVNSSILLDDANLFGCVRENKLWLVSGGELLVFDGNAIYHPEPYAPLTRSRIRCREQGTSHQNGMSESLLTGLRRNSMVGTQIEGATYDLDAKMDTSKGFLLKCGLDISLSKVGTRSRFVGHTEPKRVVKEQMSAVHGTSDVNEVINVFEGRGTNYGFDVISEINVYLKTPVYATSVIITAREGSVAPRVAFTLGAEVVYDMGDVGKYRVADLSSSLSGKMIDGITLYGNAVQARIEDIDIKGRHIYEGEVMLTYEQSSVTFGDIYYPSSIVTPLGERVRLFGSIDGSSLKGTGIVFSQGTHGTILSVLFDAPTYIDARDNIEITYSSIDYKKPYFLMGKECKTDTGEQILALVRENGGLSLTSTEHGFTYAPAKLNLQLGGQEEIVALCQMQDFVVGAYKANEAFYIRLGQESATLVGATSALGCANRNTAVTVNKDTLILSEQGVLGSVGYSDSGATLRSSGITSLISKKDLSRAFCLGYDGRLYVLLDSECYVGDTRYRHSEQNELNDGFEYEWFKLSGYSASYGCVLDGKLYLGTKDGKIRTPVDTLYDTEYQKLARGEFLIINKDDTTELHLDNALSITDDTEIVITNAQKCLFEVNFQDINEGFVAFKVSEADLFDSDGCLRLYTGESIIMQGSEGDFDAEILCVDIENRRVTVSLPCNQGYYRALSPLKGKLTLKKEQGELYYKLYQNGKKVILHNTENAWVYFISERAVEAEYVSAPLCLDGAHLAKNLHRLSLDLLPQALGKIELGYETNKMSTLCSFKEGRALDFELLDLDLMSFGNVISKAQTIRCFERGFAYIIIKIASREPYELGLRGFSLLYSVNGLLSGDRQ